MLGQGRSFSLPGFCGTGDSTGGTSLALQGRREGDTLRGILIPKGAQWGFPGSPTPAGKALQAQETSEGMCRIPLPLGHKPQSSSGLVPPHTSLTLLLQLFIVTAEGPKDRDWH